MSALAHGAVAALLVAGAAFPPQESGRADPSGATPARPAPTSASFVAARARAVLRDPGDERRWRELAEALPELGAADGAASGVALDAARHAGSSGAARVRTAGGAGGPEGGAGGRRSGGGAWNLLPPGSGLPPIDAAGVGALLAALIAAGVVVFAVRGAKPAGSRSAPAGVRRRRGPVPALRPKREPAWRREVEALAGRGLPLSEVARRTGLAQEAVAVFLGLRR